MLVLSFFIRVPIADHFADGADRYKRLRVVIADIFHQLCVLIFGKDGDNLQLFTVVVAALCFIQGHAAVQVVHDVIRQLLVVLGEDADPFASGKAADKRIDDDAVEVGAQKPMTRVLVS